MALIGQTVRGLKKILATLPLAQLLTPPHFGHMRLTVFYHDKLSYDKVKEYLGKNPPSILLGWGKDKLLVSIYTPVLDMSCQSRDMKVTRWEQLY